MHPDMVGIKFLTHFAALTLETNKKRSKSGYFHTKAEPFLCFYFASS
jgi:hypothetical protein